MLLKNSIAKQVHRLEGSLIPIFIVPILFYILFLRFHNYIQETPNPNISKAILSQIEIVYNSHKNIPTRVKTENYLTTSIDEESRGKNILKFDLKYPVNNPPNLKFLVFVLLFFYILLIARFTPQLILLRAPPA